MQLNAELAGRQTLIRQLEAELSQLKTSSCRLDSDFELAVKSRDEALRENEHLTGELELSRSTHQQAVSDRF